MFLLFFIISILLTNTLSNQIYLIGNDASQINKAGGGIICGNDMFYLTQKQADEIKNLSVDYIQLSGHGDYQVATLKKYGDKEPIPIVAKHFIAKCDKFNIAITYEIAKYRDQAISPFECQGGKSYRCLESQCHITFGNGYICSTGFDVKSQTPYDGAKYLCYGDDSKNNCDLIAW